MKSKITAIAIAIMVAIGMICVPLTNTVEAAEGQDNGKTDAVADVNTAGESDKETVPASNTNNSENLMAPESVDNIDARAKGRGKTVINWTKAEDADGYYVYSSTKKNTGYIKIMTVNGEDSTKCVHRYKKLRKNKKYYYKVYAFKTVGEKVLVSEDTDRDPAKNTLSYKKTIKMKATAYSGGGYCANGKKCKVGRVAVDPRVIPLGTWLYVKGYGFCQACDTGGAIKGKRIDLYFKTEAKCNRYGVQKTKVYVLRK
jgi:3D (Asp-Asp-Asp) domain-containing protein